MHTDNTQHDELTDRVHPWITGNFDIEIEWEPSGNGALNSDLIRVVSEQLGLVLTRSKAPVLRLVVANANRVPTEN
jgi:uncharacterized protein (TIGR03435 family)